MLSLANLVVSNFTIAMLVVWCLISIRNKQALIMVTALLVYTFVNAITTTNFCGYLITSAMFFIAATINIKLSSEFRQAFICFGAVYFIGAADQAIYYHTDVDVLFDRIQPYLVTVVNAYVLAYLISKGSKEGAKHNGLHIAAFCRRFFGLSLR